MRQLQLRYKLPDIQVGDTVKINNPASVWHGLYGEVTAVEPDKQYPFQVLFDKYKQQGKDYMKLWQPPEQVVKVDPAEAERPLREQVVEYLAINTGKYTLHGLHIKFKVPKEDLVEWLAPAVEAGWLLAKPGEVYLSRGRGNEDT